MLPAPNRESWLGLAGPPQGVSTDQSSQARPRLTQLAPLYLPGKSLSLARSLTLDRVVARGLWDTKCGSIGAEGQLWPPRRRHVPGFMDCPAYKSHVCNLESQAFGGGR